MTGVAVHLFAGPSLSGSRYQDEHGDARRALPEVTWHGPARRGDAQALLAQPPGVFALADGTFHSYPSIGHIELRDLLEAGWRLFGLCSMGALRACEMAHLGMRPWGVVAQRYVDDPDLPDDEVALVHGAEAPWLPLSEPLVHLRHFLDEMRREGVLDDERARTVASSLRERWYGERTLALLRRELDAVAAPAAWPRLHAALGEFARYRLKQRDLDQFLDAAPWRLPA